MCSERLLRTGAVVVLGSERFVTGVDRQLPFILQLGALVYPFLFNHC